MSIAIVQTGPGVGSDGTSLTISQTLTGVTANNTVLAFVGHEDSGGTNPTITVSDAQATYSPDAVAARGNQVTSGIYSLFGANSGSHATAAVANSGISANSDWSLNNQEVSGLGAVSSLDQHNTNTANPSTAPTVTTSALAQGSEYVGVALAGNNVMTGGTYPPTGGNNSPFIAVYSNPSGTGGESFDSDYQINTSATTALLIAWGTLGTSQIWCAAVATYKAATASAAFRKTLSPLGTRTGSRQIQL
jgi:hypothetical protein